MLFSVKRERNARFQKKKSQSERSILPAHVYKTLQDQILRRSSAAPKWSYAAIKILFRDSAFPFFLRGKGEGS